MKVQWISFLLIICLGAPVSAATDSELFDQGVALLKEEKPQAAVKVFSALIDRLPDHPDAYRNRGVGYMKLNQYDLAIADFEKAIEIKPDLKDLYSNLGAAWYYKGEHRRAISCYNKELGLRPDNPLGYFNRAICWADLKDFDQGLKDVNKSLSLNPDLYLALCLKGDLLVRQGRAGLARQAYEKALSLKPDHGYAARQLAALKSKFGAPGSGSGRYALQAGAFKVRANAQKLMEKLMEKGYDPRALELEGADGSQWFLVRLGRFDTRAAAEKESALVKENLGSPVIVRPTGRF